MPVHRVPQDCVEFVDNGCIAIAARGARAAVVRIQPKECRNVNPLQHTSQFDAAVPLNTADSTVSGETLVSRMMNLWIELDRNNSVKQIAHRRERLALVSTRLHEYASAMCARHRSNGGYLDFVRWWQGAPLRAPVRRRVVAQSG